MIAPFDRDQRLAKLGKRLGTVYGATEKEALTNAQKEFAKT